LQGTEFLDSTDNGARCDFCNWRLLTATDPGFGRIELPHAVTGSNLFKYAGAQQPAIREACCTAVIATQVVLLWHTSIGTVSAVLSRCALVTPPTPATVRPVAAETLHNLVIACPPCLVPSVVPSIAHTTTLVPAEPSHGVVLFKHHQPLQFSQEQLSDLLDASWLWFQASHKLQPMADQPFLLWNCLPRAGASQYHGHAQVCAAARTSCSILPCNPCKQPCVFCKQKALMQAIHEAYACDC
jgi:hypothetical protein